MTNRTAIRYPAGTNFTPFRPENKQSHLTGFLCFRNDMFLQVLEDAPAAVSAMYARIANDRRHSTVELLGDSIILSYSGQNEFDPYGMAPDFNRIPHV